MRKQLKCTRRNKHGRTTSARLFFKRSQTALGCHHYNSCFSGLDAVGDVCESRDLWLLSQERPLMFLVPGLDKPCMDIM